MRIFGITGWSGSGKTTLLVGLLPELVSRGLSVSTMKHAHHAFDVDRPGKDSYRHREAGATEVMVSSSGRWALMHENRSAPEPSVEELLSHMSPVDLVLIEGFKRHRHEKLEVYRRATGKPMIALDDPTIVAVACDEPLPGFDRPVIDLNRIDLIADFILSHCGLDDRAGASPRSDGERASP
jgi:molybdopterin-guanine dinucleotide biosynthesis protein B